MSTGSETKSGGSRIQGSTPASMRAQKRAANGGGMTDDQFVSAVKSLRHFTLPKKGNNQEDGRSEFVLAGRTYRLRDEKSEDGHMIIVTYKNSHDQIASRDFEYLDRNQPYYGYFRPTSRSEAKTEIKKMLMRHLKAIKLGKGFE